ncbi:hypothetical protein PQX77_007533 [Marasmius sp. AFHP31]|nr:hypothetical protein PQX77_007533 [Marasmius sp. AFHP31]
MSLDPKEDPPDYETIDGHGSSAPQQVPALPDSDGPSAWDGQPPEAHLPGMPSDSIMYTFSPVSSKAMVLLPPASLGSLGPLYHISVAPSLFTGSAAITTIREGGSKTGDFVADFQSTTASSDDYDSGKHWQSGTVCIRGKELLGRWRFTQARLDWDYDWEQLNVNTVERIYTVTPFTHQIPMFLTKQGAQCYHVAAIGISHRTLYAKFKPPNSAARHGPQGVAFLDVTQQGHHLLEQILVSVLILERLVTTQ